MVQRQKDWDGQGSDLIARYSKSYIYAAPTERIDNLGELVKILQCRGLNPIGCGQISYSGGDAYIEFEGPNEIVGLVAKVGHPNNEEIRPWAFYERVRK